MPGSYWAATNAAHIRFESQLELARLLLADFDPGVEGIWAQPFRLEARVDGRARWHIPDFLLRMAGGHLLVVDVKPAAKLDDPRVTERLAWPRTVLANHGLGFEVWSGCDHILLANVRFLAAYRRASVISHDRMREAAALVEEGEQLAGAERRLAGLQQPWQVRPYLLAALWFGLLRMDLDRPLSGASVLRKGLA